MIQAAFSQQHSFQPTTTRNRHVPLVGDAGKGQGARARESHLSLQSAVRAVAPSTLLTKRSSHGGEQGNNVLIPHHRDSWCRRRAILRVALAPQPSFSAGIAYCRTRLVSILVPGAKQ